MVFIVNDFLIFFVVILFVEFKIGFFKIILIFLLIFLICGRRNDLMICKFVINNKYMKIMNVDRYNLYLVIKFYFKFKNLINLLYFFNNIFCF